MADRERRKQARNRGMAVAGGCLVLVMSSFVLSACGKKPGMVDPPPDVTEDRFPLTYPDPATDPRP